MSAWRDIKTAPKDGTLFFTYWGSIPVFCAVIPDGKSFRVMSLGRDGVFYVHGNYAPFNPQMWQPLPDKPEAP